MFITKMFQFTFNMFLIQEKCCIALAIFQVWYGERRIVCQRSIKPSPISCGGFRVIIPGKPHLFNKQCQPLPSWQVIM